MKSVYKKLLLCSCAVLLLLSGCSGSDEEKPKTEEKIKIVANEIYEAPSNPTKEQAKAYNKLSKALKGDDEQKIAELVAQSFAYDFFTLYNKKNEQDVGGLTYLPEASREEFKQYAISYYYGNYSTVVNQYDKESLPYVQEDKIVKTTATPLIYNDLTYDTGYMITMELKYKDSEISADALRRKMVVQVMKDEQGIYRVIGETD